MIKQIIQDIYCYFSTYCAQACGIAFVAAVGKCMWFLLFADKEEKGNESHVWRHRLRSFVKDFLFVFYAYMVVAITLFSRREGSTDNVKLRLFSTFANNMRSKMFIVENIVMFVPLGVMVWWYGLRKYRYVLPLSILISISIEVLQWITGRGMAEVDDVMTNVVGALIGFTMVRVVKMIHTWGSNKPCRIR